jgi:hypothetical protein
MSRKMRSLAVLVVLVVLATGSVSALPLGDMRTEEGRTGFLSLVWEWLALLIEPGGAQIDPDQGQPWEKEGSQMDPNGGH